MKLGGNRQRELAAWMWNNGGAQMTAAIAMGVVVIAVIVSVQPGSILKDLIAGFGAAGQVFFAGMVWKLSREQFRFTQMVAERQKNIDLIAPRQALMTELENANAIVLEKRYAISVSHEVRDLAVRVGLIFNEKTAEAMRVYAGAVHALFEIYRSQELLMSMQAGPDDIANLFKSMGSAKTSVRHLWEEASSLAYREMKLA